MNNGQESFGNLHVATFRNGGMKIPSFFKRRVAALVIDNDRGAWRNDALNETAQRFGTTVWHHSEPNTSSVPPSPPLVETATMPTLFNLDRTGDENHDHLRLAQMLNILLIVS